MRTKSIEEGVTQGVHLGAAHKEAILDFCEAVGVKRNLSAGIRMLASHAGLLASLIRLKQ